MLEHILSVQKCKGSQEWWELKQKNTQSIYTIITLYVRNDTLLPDTEPTEQIKHILLDIEWLCLVTAYRLVFYCM
jgi:hypothetical protein